MYILREKHNSTIQQEIMTKENFLTNLYFNSFNEMKSQMYTSFLTG